MILREPGAPARSTPGAVGADPLNACPPPAACLPLSDLCAEVDKVGAMTETVGVANHGVCLDTGVNKGEDDDA